MALPFLFFFFSDSIEWCEETNGDLGSYSKLEAGSSFGWLILFASQIRTTLHSGHVFFRGYLLFGNESKVGVVDI